MSIVNTPVKQISILWVTGMLATFFRIALIPILTKQIPISEYGMWVQVNATVGLVPPLVGLGLPFAIVRFLSSVKDKNEFKKGFYEISYAVGITTAIASIVFAIMSKPISIFLFAGNDYIALLVSAIIFVQGITDLPMNFFRARQETKRYSAFILSDLVLTVAVATYFLKIGAGINGAVFGLFIAKSLNLVVMSVVVISNIGATTPNFTDLKRYAIFSAPLVPSNFANWILNTSDRYMITLLLGISFAGYYAPGYGIGALVLLFSMPFSVALPQILSKYFDEGNTSQIKKVLEASTRYYLMLAIPAVCGVSILSRPLLKILSTQEIATAGSAITMFASISYLLWGLQGMLGNILVIHNKTKVLAAVMMMAAISNVGLNLYAIPLWGINGAGVTTLLASGLSFFLIFLCGRAYVKINLDFRFIGKCFFASAAMLVILSRAKPEGMGGLILTICVGATVYFGAMVLMRGIEKKEVLAWKRGWGVEDYGGII